MLPKLLSAYSGPVPRYTSYPTAPHFSAAVTNGHYKDWLAAIEPGQSLSLYAHIPFCDTLCWFCGCHTKITRRYRPVQEYLDGLCDEIGAVAALSGAPAPVRYLHWGGGSPTILEADDIARLAGRLREVFTFAADAEFAVEIDPRGLSGEQIAALGAAGVTRASIGVQDFNARVQQAINRIQPFGETRDVIAGLREAGISAINIDLMYGLPHQDETQIAATIDQVLTLAPDRIALFGYAHVPWMKRHQEMISETDLPGIADRFAQAEFAARMLAAAGYERIGLDHFARHDDALARAARQGVLRRNFQGYTADAADVLLGFGASAIGQLPQGYIQNHAPIGEYLRQVGEHGTAVARGYQLRDEDRRRAWLIERIMCDLKLSWADAEREIGPADDLRRELVEPFTRFAADGLIRQDGDGFEVTEAGRPFVRTVCSAFDAFLPGGAARHSVAV